MKMDLNGINSSDSSEDRAHNPGTDGVHHDTAKGAYHNNTLGAHDHGVVRVHDIGLIGFNHHDSMQTNKRSSNEGEKWQYDRNSDRGLTLIQKRIMLWLVMMCKGRELQFISFYKKIGCVVGITQRAAAVHVKALERKNYIVTSCI